MTWSRRGSVRWGSVWLVGGLVCLLLSAGCSGGSSPAASDLDEAASATAVAVATVEPTVTVVPTATPESTVKPTSTPVPTATPEPTVEPTPTAQLVFPATDAEPASDPDEEPLKYAAELTALKYTSILDEFSADPASFSRARIAPYASEDLVDELEDFLESRTNLFEQEAGRHEVMRTVEVEDGHYIVVLCAYALGRIVDFDGNVDSNVDTTWFKEVDVRTLNGAWEVYSPGRSGGRVEGEGSCEELFG